MKSEPRCPYNRQDAADDCSCSMDFNLLFDEAAGPLSLHERGSRRESGGTYVYLRVLKRMCVPEDDHMREVMDVAKEALRPLTVDQLKQRELVIQTVLRAMNEAGCNPRAVTSRRTYGAGGVMCPQHTYLQVAGSPEDYQQQSLIVEPLLRDAFQIVRSTEQYQRLLEAVPSVFVGTPTALTDLVEFMAARMEESFQEKGMSCPPWRQVRSVLAKWGLTRACGSGSTKPTTSLTPTKSTHEDVSNDSTRIRFGGDSKRKAAYALGTEPKETPAPSLPEDLRVRRSSLLSELRCRPGAGPVVTAGGCTNAPYACMR